MPQSLNQLRAFDLITVGTLYNESVFHGEFLPHVGQTIIGDHHGQSPGGSGVIQAIAGARMGARVALIGQLGDDAEGETILALLKSEGVDTEMIHRSAGSTTGRKVRLLDRSNEQMSMLVPGANETLGVSHILEWSSALQSAKSVVIDMDVPFECAARAIQLAAGGTAKVIVNASSSSALPNEFMTWIDVMRADRHESLRIGGESVSSEREAGRLVAERLLWRGVENVIVESGRTEKLVAWDDHEFWLPGYDLGRGDDAGEGDAFLAAIGVALAEGRTVLEAATLANAAAALSTLERGPLDGLPSRRQVMAFLEKEDIHLQRGKPTAA